MKLKLGGKLNNIIKYNKNSENMFICPIRIKTNEDMICVLDATSESRKLLIALHENTAYLWTLTGGLFRNLTGHLIQVEWQYLNMVMSY